jgi:adenylyltransferase and sulfurtransferase
MVLNHPALPPGDVLGGPCYRCVFPRPPPAETVVSCGDGGILGPVVGVMGVLQALEAIKVITTMAAAAAAVAAPDSSASGGAEHHPSMLLFSAYDSVPFRSIRLRRRKQNCAACSAHATVTRESLRSGSMDYVQFCGVAEPVNLLSPEERVTALAYAEEQLKPHVLIDVREEVQFDLCHLEGSVNVPYSQIVGSQKGEDTRLDLRLKSVLGKGHLKPIYVVCRLGNDSQIVVRRFKELGLDAGGSRWIGDVKGGLKAWREDVDPELPSY